MSFSRMQPIVRTAVCVLAVLASERARPQPIAPAQNAAPASASTLPPLPTSPIEQIRQILAMSRAERQQFLAVKKPQHRQFLTAKLAEFDALTPAEREERLQSLQLRDYMRSLMKLPAADRPTALMSVPVQERAFIEERLQLWDQLTPEQQKLFLEHEAEVRRQASEAGVIPRARVLDTHTPFDLALMENQIRSWNALPEQKRQEIKAQFERFFALPRYKKTQVREALTPAERNALTALDRLPEADRERCLEGFQKFVGLSPAERHEFLKAAARWKKMDESQRQPWRKLANQLPPDFPLPPGFNRPPLPQGLKRIEFPPPASPSPPN